MNERDNRRPYTSPLREEQAEQTRLRILDGLMAAIREGEADVSVPALASRCGVSVPTIYRHYPTRDALLAALVAHVDGLVPVPATELDPMRPAEMIRAFFRHRAQVATLLGPHADSPLVWQVRREHTVPRRRGFCAQMVDAWAPALDDRRRAWAIDVLVVLLSSSTESAFRNYLGCDADATADRVVFLVEALRAQLCSEVTP